MYFFSKTRDSKGRKLLSDSFLAFGHHCHFSPILKVSLWMTWLFSIRSNWMRKCRSGSPVGTLCPACLLVTFSPRFTKVEDVSAMMSKSNPLSIMAFSPLTFGMPEPGK